jgi:hypothetical protein
MKNTSILILLMTFSSLASCKKVENCSCEDKILQAQLVGTWKSLDYTDKIISFRLDGTFTDSLFYVFSDSISGPELGEVISGSYIVRDEQIEYSNLKLVYTKYRALGYPQHIFWYEALNDLQLNGENLVLSPKTKLVALEKKNSSIQGKWHSNNLVAVYDQRLNQSFTGGSLNSTFEFTNDLQVNWNYEINYDTIHIPSELSTNYEFDNSILDLHQWGFIVNVSFSKKGEMFWVYYNQTLQKVR